MGRKVELVTMLMYYPPLRDSIDEALSVTPMVAAVDILGLSPVVVNLHWCSDGKIYDW